MGINPDATYNKVSFLRFCIAENGIITQHIKAVRDTERKALYILFHSSALAIPNITIYAESYFMVTSIELNKYKY